jgi:glycosyltransferase involved in cell wall biosynthesis
MIHPFAYLFERFPSFVQTFCYREVREMVRQGMNPLVVSLRQPEEAPSLAEPLKIPITYLPAEKKLRSEIDLHLVARNLPSRVRKILKQRRSESDAQRIFEAAWLGPVLAEKNIRHVHAHFGGMAARTAWWLNELYGFSYSFTGHANDIFVEHDTPVTNAMLVKRAKLVVTETDFARRWMEEHHARAQGKIVRIHNGINIPEATPRVVANPPHLVSVGRFVEKKGFSELLECCHVLRDRGLDFVCTIAGGGPLEEELQQQIERLKLESYVRLLGPLPQAEVARLLSAATLFVLACVPEKDGGSDNLPTVVVEAMAAGVPTVSTTVAGLPEMITSDQDGLLVEPHAPAQLASAIERLLEDPAVAARLGAAGRETARRKFAIENTVRELKHLMVDRLRIPAPPPARAYDPEWHPVERKWWRFW